MAYLCSIALCVFLVGFAEANPRTIHVEVSGHEELLKITVGADALIGEVVTKAEEKVKEELGEHVEILRVQEKVMEPGKNEHPGKILGGNRTKHESARGIEKVYVVLKHVKNEDENAETEVHEHPHAHEKKEHTFKPSENRYGVLNVEEPEEEDDKENVHPHEHEVKTVVE
ncbi:hypothetical protein Ddc_11229 [Ditylenchus destructor]|nr:hypothetical protein Ddc_11229 [Ditylenchus destructor]